MAHKSKYNLDDDEYFAKIKWDSRRKRNARKNKEQRMKIYEYVVQNNYNRRRAS